MQLYRNQVFAPIDSDLELERFAGGNETEVYRTDDRRFVVKLKSELDASVTVDVALAYARALRDAAEQFAACLGQEHSIHSDYLLARDDAGHIQVLVVQPFMKGARALHGLDYAQLTPDEREYIAVQLTEIIRRSRVFYRQTGDMPDLYGRSTSNAGERRRLRRLSGLPNRLWYLFIKGHLLRSHNLLLTDVPERRVILIDYDALRRGKLYRYLLYTLRLFLFWRDRFVIAKMRRTSSAGKGKDS